MMFPIRGRVAQDIDMLAAHIAGFSPGGMRAIARQAPVNGGQRPL